MIPSNLTVRLTVPNLQLINELLLLRIDLLKAGKVPTPELAHAVSSAYSVSLRRRYPLIQICRAWGLSRSGVYRWVRTRTPLSTNSAHPISDDQIVEKLRELVRESPFRSERHRKLWARLRQSGMLVSRERVRRLLRQYPILPQRGLGILTDKPDVMWGIDSTKLKTTMEGLAHVLFVIDHCTAECLGIGVTGEETAECWVKVIEQAIAKAFGSVLPGIAAGLTLRHDNDPLFRHQSFRSPLKRFGIRFSASPLLTPQMNGCAERFVGTLRSNLLSIRYFQTLSEILHATREFQTAYNEQWLIARAGYRTPAQIREFVRSFKLSLNS